MVAFEIGRNKRFETERQKVSVNRERLHRIGIGRLLGFVDGEGSSCPRCLPSFPKEVLDILDMIPEPAPRIGTKAATEA